MKRYNMALKHDEGAAQVRLVENEAGELVRHADALQAVEFERGAVVAYLLSLAGGMAQRQHQLTPDEVAGLADLIREGEHVKQAKEVSINAAIQKPPS